MDGGRREVERLLALYRDCVERDVWPGYADEVEDLFPPAWLLGEEGDPDES
jgi:hypothetical protein